ncbi:hypothetical protein F4604DRAFT_1921682 [Suillus subluteus]|nr:hypothetical protein F4604DRAFT_1921682 [Suillus subluteus]
MPMEDISKLPLSTQPPNTVAISTTPPTHHMNTDSRTNKRNHPTSLNAATNPQSGGNATQSQDPTPSISTPTNKCPNIDCPPQQPSTPNQWDYLSTSNYTKKLSVNGVRMLDSGFRITATLWEASPPPQLGQSTWCNISQILKEKWPQKEGAKVTPTAAVELIKRLPPPWHFLVSDIPPEVIERLICLQVCSSPEISCFFIPFKQPLPTYAFTLENFSFPDSESTNKVITEIIKDTIHSNPEILQFIHDNIPFPNAEAALRTVKSVKVSSLILAHSKTVKETVWNIYFESPPAFTLKQYFNWTNLLQTFFYISEDYGYGIACQDAQFTCVGCKSFDHPTGLCPFPKIPGWFGPSITEDTNATLDNCTMSNHGRGALNNSMSRGSRGFTRGHYRGSPRGQDWKGKDRAF